MNRMKPAPKPTSNRPDPAGPQIARQARAQRSRAAMWERLAASLATIAAKSMDRVRHPLPRRLRTTDAHGVVRPVVWVHQHAGHPYTPYRNPNRVQRLAKSGRLRAELRDQAGVSR